MRLYLSVARKAPSEREDKGRCERVVNLKYHKSLSSVEMLGVANKVLFGHKSSKTTEIYIHVAMKNLRKIEVR
ncbi:MAG: hypothetical protein OD815_001104 [Candidatus Alkanophagales archaeon MCA70_species_2]|nr:hypothetical protein [Candidatus Alkanophaga liquidiphilum]RLG37150.1 MAG: hypothetical protein DRN91_06180 [Candidatus Alkanophagales archaeon]